jgi:serpin B
MKTKLSRILSILLVSSLLLSACGPGEAKSRLDRDVPDAAARADLPELVAGNTAFALDLFQAARSPEADLVFSPYSISLAFAMAYAGAQGDTAAQMAEVLHYSLPPERLHAAWNVLDQALAGRPEEAAWVDEQDRFRLHIANAVWGQEDWPFEPAYLDRLALDYGAGVRLVDFVGAPEAARRQINDWVSEQTRRRIRDIVPPGVVTPDTRLVLANAIYFKATWQEEFDPDLTSADIFTLLDGSQVPVEMMSIGHGAGLPYAAGDGWQAVSLPYQGGLNEMLVLLPDEGRFEEFSVGFAVDRYQAILDSMQVNSVILAMPKFTFESPLGLSDLLVGMGMPDAFDPLAADFSGIDGAQDLYIGDALHKAFVAVDEQGTEAAAATVILMMMASAPVSEIQLTINRPFLFFIRDVPSGTVLFLGQVLDPR